ITPDGMYVSDGLITIMRNDGAPYIINGVPQFEIPIIMKRNMDEGVNLVRNDYETTNKTFSSFESGWTSHAGRYANFGFQPGLKYNSVSASARIEVEISTLNSPTGVTIDTVTYNQIIYRDQPSESFVLNVPMPPPTYQAVTFVIKFRVVSSAT